MMTSSPPAPPNANDQLSPIRSSRPKTDSESRASREAAEQTWQQAIIQRENYLFRQKERPDERGRVPLVCPAAGPAPTVNCPLKPNPGAMSKAQRNGRVLLDIVGLAKPGKVCTNKTSTSFHINDGGALEQHYQYGSREWAATYRHMRNRVESTNAYAKEDSTFALARSGRRRMRGYTAQSTLIALTLVAVNMQILHDFLLECDERALERELGLPSPARRTNRSRRSSPQARMASARRNRNRGEHMATAGSRAAVTRT